MGLSGFGREGLLQHRHVEHLGRLLTHLERLRLAVGLQGDAVEVAVGAIQLLRLLVVDVIIGGAESRCGRRAQLDVVDVEQEIARAVVGRLQVGHHEQFVKLGSGIAADGEHGVEPLVLAHLGVAVLAFEVADDMVVAGLCSCADGQEQRGQADVLFQIHGEWNKG